MVYKRFYIQVIIRVLLLVASTLVFGFIFGDERLFFNQIIVGILLVLQTLEFIRYVNHTNRELARLFLAVKHEDFSASFQQADRGKSFHYLQESIAGLIQSFKQVKIEKEAQFQFLQMLVRQLHIGIITLENDSDIVLINPTAESLHQMKGVKNWNLVKQLNPEFYNEVNNLGGEGRKLVTLQHHQQNKVLALDVRTLLILEKPVVLITFQDINNELEQKEFEAWNRLIRILTHEIMNSVTPISSLTETMKGMLEDRGGKQKVKKEIGEETIADLRFSIETIHKRSEGLLGFVETYRKLTKIPIPSKTSISVHQLITSIHRLMKGDLETRKIEVNILVDPVDLEANLDEKLIEQVLINLITNSSHALEGIEQPAIQLTAAQKGNKVMIVVKDNGKGIPPEVLPEIFVPFYSTKKEGSGIGLSLSKQIMHLHGGSIRVESTPERGTSFYLNFPKPII